MWETIQTFISEQFNANQFLQGGILLTIFGGLAMQLKGVPSKIWERARRRFNYQITIEEYGSPRLYKFFEQWLQENHKGNYRKLKAKLYTINDKDDDICSETFPNKISKANTNYIENASSETSFDKFLNEPPIHMEESTKFINNITKLSLEQANDFFYFWRKKRFIRISQDRDKLEHATNLSALFNEHYTISAWFGKKILNDLLKEIIDWAEEIQQSKQQTSTSIYSASQHGDTSHLHDIDIKSLDNIIINNKDKLLKDIIEFNNNKYWYKSRSIPYKRGFLFYGLPGNGKTTLAISLARYFKKDIIVANLSNMKNDGLERLFTIHLNSGNILLLEDIDAMFTNNKSKTTRDTENDVCFSTLLNCLDGVFSKEGSLVIMTTNHPEKLDPALIRKGRIDFKFEVSNPSIESIEKYMSLFFETNVNIAIADHAYSRNLSMVDVQNLCIDYKNSKVNALNEIIKQIKFK